jgi:hypothetical protein
MSGPLAALVDGRLLHDPQFNAKSLIYRVEDVAEVVRIERVGPRREIYRPT